MGHWSANLGACSSPLCEGRAWFFGVRTRAIHGRTITALRNFTFFSFVVGNFPCVRRPLGP